jgi:hypothetical protein
MVVGLFLYFLAEAAAYGSPLDFEQLTFFVRGFLLIAGGERYMFLQIAGAMAIVLVVLVETEISAFLFHLFVSMIADPDFS